MRVGVGLLCCLVPFVVADGVDQQPVYSKSVNLVDRLSSDPDFTLLLRLLQRARLIPTLNRVQDATLFAPTNGAIERYRNSTSFAARLWSLSTHTTETEQDAKPPDNVQYQLRQHLLYHILNYSLPIMPLEFPNQRPIALDTLHYPDVAYSPPPTDQPAPAPPWLPEPGGSLNSAPQRLRVGSRDSAAWVGVDSTGRGGVQVVKKPLLASNGIIVAVNDVVQLPEHLYGEIMKRPDLQELGSILGGEMEESLRTSPHLTLFVPIDSAWTRLDSIERKYLRSGFAERDVSRLVSLHLSGAGVNSTGDVGWSDTWGDGITFTTAGGQNLTIGFSANGSIQISQSTLVHQDIYAANGVIHVISDLLIGPDTFKINAEKYLLALNATTFVELLRAADLSHYVDDEHDGQTWTILAPRDDIIDSWAHKPRGSELHRVLLYHFIPGKLSTKDLVDGALLGTELREVGLDGGRQRLPVSVRRNGKVEPDANGDIGFGNARVIGEPVKTDNFVVYMISQILQPPEDAIVKIQSSARLSTFLAAAYASEMTQKLRTEHSTTLVVPHNDGFERLGLLTDYLLLPDSRSDLRRVIKYHMLKGVYYSSDFSFGGDTTRNISTREGTPIIVDHGVKVRESGMWNRTSSLVPRDDLTQTGVIHEVKDVLLPSTVRVNIGDLARAAGGNTMVTLIHRAGLGGLLNGSLTLEDVDDIDGWKRSHKRSRSASSSSLYDRNAPIGWTLICPRDSAFKSVNLTRLFDDDEALRSLVMQHIIPVTPIMTPLALDPELPLSYADESKYTTLLSQNSLRADLVFRVTAQPGAPLPRSEILVGIKGARGSDGVRDFARVIGYGRTTVPGGARSGVLQVDRVLEPWIPDWWNAWGKPVTSGIIGGVLIVAFWAFVLRIWWRRDEEPTYEPLNGDIQAEDDY